MPCVVTEARAHPLFCSLKPLFNDVLVAVVVVVCLSSLLSVLCDCHDKGFFCQRLSDATLEVIPKLCTKCFLNLGLQKFT